MEITEVFLISLNKFPFAKNYRVIAVDTRGQGRSTDLTQDAYSYEKFASDLYQVIKSLNLEQVDIIGWSDGGNTALILTMNIRKWLTVLLLLVPI